MENETTVRVSAKVEKRSVIGKRGGVYDAECGKVSVSGAPSRAEAAKRLTEAVSAALDSFGSPVILWSLDGREVWIAFPTEHGWGYAINDAGRAYNSREGSPLYHNGGSWPTREECLDRMRAHWYDVNARYIVDGILGLCTDQRQWVCKRCASVSRSGAPYKCRNPACEADAPAFDW